MQTHFERNEYFYGLFISAIVSALIAFLLLHPAMLLGLSSYWYNATGDNAATLGGYLAFIHDQWRWPLLYTTMVDPPEGVNVYYFDGIPFLLLVGKALYWATGYTFIYAGPWIVLGYVMNGVLGYAILRFLNIPVTSATIGSLFFVLLPAFLWRFVHTALSGQFLILFAIYLYLRFTSISSRREMVACTATSGLMVLFSPYLMVMFIAIVSAGLLDAHHRNRISASSVGVALAGFFAVMASTAYALGIIGNHTSMPTIEGFGHYSMNVLSPIWPQWSLLSFHRGFLDATGGQYEGMNYLGAGVLGLCIFILATACTTAIKHLKSRPFLIAVCAILVIYAISSEVYIGQWHVASLQYERLPFVRSITSIFRSSGRFFWPVGYLIVIGAIYLISRRFDSDRRLALLLAAALILQIFDLSPLYRLMKHNVRPAEPLPQAEAIAYLMAQHDEVIFFPKVLCAPRSDEDKILRFQLMSAAQGKPFTGAYMARGNIDCAGSTEAFWRNPFDAAGKSNPLLIMMRSSISSNVRTFAMPVDAECRQTQSAYICRQRSGGRSFASVGDPIPNPTPYPFGRDVEINGAGQEFLGKGWSAAEGDFRWAIGPETHILALLPESVCQSIKFDADVQPFAFKDYKVDEASISASGGPARKAIMTNAASQHVSVTLPVKNCTDRMDIRINFNNPKSPSDLGMSSDPRQVTWAFRSFGLKASQ